MENHVGAIVRKLMFTFRFIEVGFCKIDSAKHPDGSTWTTYQYTLFEGTKYKKSGRYFDEFLCVGDFLAKVKVKDVSQSTKDRKNRDIALKRSILDALGKNQGKPMSKAQIMKSAGAANNNSFHRIIKLLRDNGAIVMEGKGRGVKYTLKNTK